ncbi:DUF6220 domain-containing protein [Falsiroseomonas sp.]|uniref:DUF6220 domain-containing protein n=1 Tax=Falsiroseomonas sp. TaxID=2870721 RepID=UPI002736363C|nr:DUF6220 domain-containing protein [Falsiroseomonas sp.]MDP3415255.1 DUF6220 domain-containing protein [Falsiroseomonas sp.]
MKRPFLAVLIAAFITPVLILAQFLLAGLALFPGGTDWSAHKALGVMLLLPILILVLDRSLRRRALLVALLYVLQIMWIVLGQKLNSALLQALHPFNAGLLLTAALLLAAQVARSPRG